MKKFKVKGRIEHCALFAPNGLKVSSEKFGFFLHSLRDFEGSNEDFAAINSRLRESECQDRIFREGIVMSTRQRPVVIGVPQKLIEFGIINNVNVDLFLNSLDVEIVGSAYQITRPNCSTATAMMQRFTVSAVRFIEVPVVPTEDQLWEMSCAHDIALARHAILRAKYDH